MSLYTNPLNKYKKRFQQTENLNQDGNEFLLGKKKQILLHGSPITLILRNAAAKCRNELKLSSNPYEIQVGDYNFIEIQRLKEIFKEVDKTRKRHNWKQIKILTLLLGRDFGGPLQDFEHIASLFARSFSDLTTLSLERLDEKLGLCLISKIGRDLLKLKDLSLDFNPFRNVNECIKILAIETLGSLVSLRYLHLDFGGSKTITSNEVDLLCDGINKKAPGLVSLILGFSSCTHFNDKCLDVLGSKLCRGLAELNSLELSLSINDITNQGVISLSNFVTFDLHKLRKLSIDIFHCERVTTEGFVSLGEKIAENLKHLQEICFYAGIELRPEEDEDEEADEAEDNEIEKERLYQLLIEKETAYRDEMYEKLHKTLYSSPKMTLWLNCDVLLG